MCCGFIKNFVITVFLQNLLSGENLAICEMCYKKSEEYYNFKKQCLFIEDSLKPFVVENVKIDLKEIRCQIIKSEDYIESDKSVCRLCLQYIDNDGMTLSKKENGQFC